MHSDRWLDAHAERAAAAWVAGGGGAGAVELGREGTGYEVDPATGEFGLAEEPAPPAPTTGVASR
jgi:hypothetical protein